MMKTVKAVLSGHCGRGMPEWSHRRCSGRVGRYECPCPCHVKHCPTCTCETSS